MLRNYPESLYIKVQDLATGIRFKMGEQIYVDRREPSSRLDLRFFLFVTFFNNILTLTRLLFYLHGITRLVAPMQLARQLAFVAPIHMARQRRHAGRPNHPCTT